MQEEEVVPEPEAVQDEPEAAQDEPEAAQKEEADVEAASTEVASESTSASAEEEARAADETSRSKPFKRPLDMQRMFLSWKNKATDSESAEVASEAVEAEEAVEVAAEAEEAVEVVFTSSTVEVAPAELVEAAVARREQRGTFALRSSRRRIAAWYDAVQEELPEPEGSAPAPVYIDKQPDWREVERLKEQKDKAEKQKANVAMANIQAMARPLSPAKAKDTEPPTRKVESGMLAPAMSRLKKAAWKTLSGVLSTDASAPRVAAEKAQNEAKAKAKAAKEEAFISSSKDVNNVVNFFLGDLARKKKRQPDTYLMRQQWRRARFVRPPAVVRMQRWNEAGFQLRQSLWEEQYRSPKFPKRERRDYAELERTRDYFRKQAEEKAAGFAERQREMEAARGGAKTEKEERLLREMTQEMTAARQQRMRGDMQSSTGEFQRRPAAARVEEWVSVAEDRASWDEGDSSDVEDEVEAAGALEAAAEAMQLEATQAVAQAVQAEATEAVAAAEATEAEAAEEVTEAEAVEEVEEAVEEAEEAAEEVEEAVEAAVAETSAPAPAIPEDTSELSEMEAVKARMRLLADRQRAKLGAGPAQFAPPGATEITADDAARAAMERARALVSGDVSSPSVASRGSLPLLPSARARDLDAVKARVRELANRAQEAQGQPMSSLYAQRIGLSQVATAAAAAATEQIASPSPPPPPMQTEPVEVASEDVAADETVAAESEEEEEEELLSPEQRAFLERKQQQTSAEIADDTSASTSAPGEEEEKEVAEATAAPDGDFWASVAASAEPEDEGEEVVAEEAVPMVDTAVTDAKREASATEEAVEAKLAESRDFLAAAAENGAAAASAEVAVVARSTAEEAVASRAEVLSRAQAALAKSRKFLEKKEGGGEDDAASSSSSAEDN